ncbi:MAG: hypothetical protein ABIS29_01540 [Vicinamibacterales bacterium]
MKPAITRSNFFFATYNGFYTVAFGKFDRKNHLISHRETHEVWAHQWKATRMLSSQVALVVRRCVPKSVAALPKTTNCCAGNNLRMRGDGNRQTPTAGLSHRDRRGEMECRHDAF